MFASGWAVLVAAVGSVLLVAAVVLARRWGGRRSVGVAGAGLLLFGLALSGFVGILAQLLAVGLNPVRWLGLVAAGVGVVMLSTAGMLPGRRRSRGGAASPELPGGPAGRSASPSVQRSGGTAAKPSQRQSVDDDMAEIEEILRRRGIQ